MPFHENGPLSTATRPSRMARTIPDLVRLLGVTRQTIHTYRKAGKIPEPRRFAVPGRKGYQPAWSPEQMHAILVSMGEEAR